MSYEVIRHSAGGKAIAYIFDKIVKDNSAGHWQIGARFKGRGDREWIVIYVPSDSDHSYNGFIRLFNEEKGDIVIRPEEMAKAARLLTNFYNSPSRPGNEKQTTQIKPQSSLKHAANESAFTPNSVNTHIYIPDRKLTNRPGYIGLACYSSKDNEVDIYVPINQIKDKRNLAFKFTQALKAKDKLGSFRNGSMNGIEKFFEDELYAINHSAVDDDEIIDCTDEVLEHASNKKTYKFVREFSGANFMDAYGDITLAFCPEDTSNFTLEINPIAADFEYIRYSVYDVAKNIKSVSDMKNKIIRDSRFKGFTVSNASAAAAYMWATTQDCVGQQNMTGRIKKSPNKVGSSKNDYIAHAANPYPYRPDVKLNGNQLVITFTDVTNNRTATASVNLVGCKNYKDVENRLDVVLTYAYEDGKDWGNISKKAFDEIMRQARVLNIFNEKTLTNTSLSKRSKSARHSLFSVVYEDDDYLEHHGILGQKWGVRRYQNADGSLTDAGKTHYGKKKSDYQNLMSKATAARNEAADYLEKKPRSKQQKAANASMLDKADKFQKKAEKIAEDVEKKTGKKITISKEDKAAIDRVMKYYSQKSVKEINGDRALQAASGFLGGFVGSMAVASISLAAGENLVSKYKYNW